MNETLQDRLEKVQAEVAAACDRAGRSVDDVKLMAVTKKFTVDVVREVAACGLRIIGENRVQEAAQKIPESPSTLDWHLIGHLQTNKARQAVHYFSTVHSVDSLRLIDALQEATEKDNDQLNVLLQVNISGEQQKSGCHPDDVAELIERVEASSGLTLQGLMTMPPWSPDKEKTRPVFRQLRELRDRLENECNVGLPELSMGMSHDYTVAIEEGATYVRLGTALLGARKG